MRPGSLATSSWPRCWRRERRSSCARPCTPRRGSTRCRTTRRRCAAAGSTSSNPGWAGWPEADAGAGRLAEPEVIVGAVEQVSTRRPTWPAWTCWSPPGHAGADRRRADHRELLVGQAGLRVGGRGCPPVRRKVTLVSTAALPAPAGVEIIAVETAAEMAEAVIRRADEADVVVMAARRRISAGRAARTGRSEGVGPPRSALEPTVDILARLGQRRRPGQVSSASPPRPTNVAGKRRAQAAPQAPRPHRGQRRLRARAPGLRVRHQRRDRSSGWWPVENVPRPTRGCRRRRPRRGGSCPLSRSRQHRRTTKEHTRAVGPSTSGSVTEGHRQDRRPGSDAGNLDAILSVDRPAGLACARRRSTIACGVVAGEADDAAVRGHPLDRLEYDQVDRLRPREASGFDGNTGGDLSPSTSRARTSAKGVDRLEEVWYWQGGRRGPAQRRGRRRPGDDVRLRLQRDGQWSDAPADRACAPYGRAAGRGSPADITRTPPDGKTQATSTYED